jgi:hypothetical protein
MTLAEILKLVPQKCRHGHLMIGDNVREERNATSKGGVRLRCKQCVKAQKARAWARPDFRTRQMTYAHHYRCGHHEGLSWNEIKSNRRSETT